MDSKINKYSIKVKIRDIHPVLENAEAKAELKTIHQDFVVVSIDKAANNVSFICKRHYADVIKTELQYPQGRVTRSQNTERTYGEIGNPPNEIVNAHSTQLRAYGLKLEEDWFAFYVFDTQTT